MNFAFVVFANTAQELRSEIAKIVEDWWPNKDWITNIQSIQQVVEEAEETTDKKKELKLCFEVTVEIYQRSLVTMPFMVR